MRRTPAVASVGLLLGLSGCAGVPQRLSWSSPATDRSDPTDNAHTQSIGVVAPAANRKLLIRPNCKSRRNSRLPSRPHPQAAERRLARISG